MRLKAKHLVTRPLLGLVASALVALGTSVASADCACSGSYVGDISCDAAGCDTGCGGSTCGDCSIGCGHCGDGGCSTCGDGSCSTCGDGACVCGARGYGQPDLFYNFYTQGHANRVNAQMYLSPGPVPPNVGHTFYTYQPFYPHHMLYWHKDRYHRYYDNGRGMNRTRAVYYSPPVRQFLSNLYWNHLRLPR